MINIEDRVSTRAGRVLVTDENTGEQYYATIERADEPTVEGTKINKALFTSIGNDIVTKAPIIHASTGTEFGIGTQGTFGHVKQITPTSTGQSFPENSGLALSSAFGGNLYAELRDAFKPLTKEIRISILEASNPSIYADRYKMSIFAESRWFDCDNGYYLTGIWSAYPRLSNANIQIYLMNINEVSGRSSAQIEVGVVNQDEYRYENLDIVVTILQAKKNIPMNWVYRDFEL